MKPPTVVETITALAKARATVELDDQGRLVVDCRRPLDARTARLVRRHRLLLAWAVVGRSTGHEWMPCDTCGEAQLLEPAKAGRLCHLTAGCKGHVHRPTHHLLDPKISATRRPPDVA